MPRESVVVREWSVPVSTGAVDGLRIAHVSDLHFRRWNRVYEAAQRALLSLEYDLLVVTGDFGCFRRHWQRAAGLTRQFLEPLAERGSIYAVLGNHDDPRIAAAPDMPLTFLRNDHRTVETPSGVVTLVGVEQTRRGSERLSAALEGAAGHPPTILLAHYPSTVFRLPTGQVDLVLSGHTHGGQIRLPWVGCVWANDRVPRRMARGLHVANGTPIHVSAGIGVSLPLRVRVNCPAEIAVLTLRAEAKRKSVDGEAVAPHRDENIALSLRPLSV